MAQENTASQQLYDLLVTKNFDPKSLDSMGKPTVNPSEADLFSFNFSTNDNEYGTVVILINGDNDLEVYYGDNLGKGMEPGDRGDWYDFLAMIRQTAKRNLLTFSLNNMNKLKHSMATMAGISESLVMEAWKGQGKSKSYSNQPGNAKVVIQHSRQIGEGEQRFRNIGALFVENAQGERFRMPFKSIAGAKAMARHVSEGGTPYDAFGQHISETINEIGTLGKFVRASRGNAFAQNEQALGIVEDAVNHYADLKRKAKKMIGKRGYKEIFATYDPAVATELDETIENVREVFVNSAVDSRIEEALPILAKIKEKTMRESDIFEQWTNQMMEGTWALVDTEEEIQMLKDLLAKPLPCGPDGEYATEQLYDLIGDDQLFDEIGDLADTEGADADCREIVRARAEELGIDVGEIDHSVYGESIVEDPTQEEPASGYEAGQARGAAGKSRSLGMNLGGQDVVKTAGGSDIEEDTINESPVGDAIKHAYDSVYEFVGQYDDAALEYLDDNAPMFSKMFEKYEDLDVMISKCDDATCKQIADELYDVADQLEGGVLESSNELSRIKSLAFGIEEDYQGGGDKVMFKGREIDTDTIDYDMEDISDLIFNIDYGVKYTDGSLVDEADYDALTYTDDIIDFVRIDYMDSFREGVDNFVNPTDQANKISNSEQNDLDSEDMTENEEMEDLLRLAGRGNVNEAKSPPEVINPTKDSSPADLKAAMKYAKYMKAKMDTDKAKATYDKEIAQLQGWMKAKSVTKETQDIDTGKEVVKAEREPMLERILQLSKW